MIDEKGIRERLRELYGGPGWTVYEELPRGGAQKSLGGAPHRTIDMFCAYQPAGGLRQHRFVAIEIKVSRADLACELAKPSKRKVWENAVDECWFATPHDLCRPDQIPDPWGLITFTEGLVCHAKQPVWCAGHPDKELAYRLGMRKSGYGNPWLNLQAHVDAAIAKRFKAFAKEQGTTTAVAITEALAEYLDRRNIPYHRSIPLDLSA